VRDPPMTFTILSGRWVGNTGCPAKSSTKGGHPNHERSSFVVPGVKMLVRVNEIARATQWAFAAASTVAAVRILMLLMTLK
jgi:hypothetical protein